MKLRTIALAGLLGAGLLMTSGCDEDSVTKAIADALKVNIVHVANGTDHQVTFDIEGEPDANKQIVDPLKTKTFFVEGKNSYKVSNTTFNKEVSFPKDSAHLYAVCANDAGVLTDSATANTRQIEVLNLTNTTIGTVADPLTITLYNAKDAVLATATVTQTTVSACKQKALTFDKTLDLIDVKKVGVNDANITVPSYDNDVQEKLDQLNDVDFDIVVFDANASAPKGKIVPLATPVQLGKD